MLELLCINQWQPVFAKEGFRRFCFLYKKGILFATFNLFSDHDRGFFVVAVFTGGCWHNVSFLCPQIYNFIYVSPIMPYTFYCAETAPTGRPGIPKFQKI